MLRLYAGRENIDKERFVYERIKERGGETLVLVPDQYTLAAEEQALKYLETDCLFDTEILSMNRLGLRVLTEQGTESVRMLDKYGRFMLLTKIIREHEGELEIFRRSAGKISFTAMLNDFISEFKQQNCNLDEMEAMLSEAGDYPTLAAKIKEIGGVIKAYEASIEGRYTDPEDYISMYVEAMGTSRELAGKVFIVTGTGKYFKNVEGDPETNLGIVRISADGASSELLWGFKDGGAPTSEFPAHMMSHIARLSVNPANRVIMHSHPTNTLAMTYVHSLDERDFTRTLWQLNTECIVVFPDGVGVLPWMVCGTNEIGEATAEKMKEFRLVVWPVHGIYGAGVDIDEAFGLIETVEKTAKCYLLASHMPIINKISDEQLMGLVKRFDLDYRKDFLDLC